MISLSNAVLVGAAVLLASCTPKSADLNCRGDEKECLGQQLDEHKVKKMNFWKEYLKAPVESRIDYAPPDLIHYLGIDNKLNGWKAIPTLPDKDLSLKEDVRAAFASLPESVKAKLSKHLVGIFLVKNLGSTGYTEYVVKALGENPVAAFVVIDQEVLNRNANDWASWREQSVFRKNGDDLISVKIAVKNEDNPRSAMQFILLHEFGHVLSIADTFHPHWGAHGETPLQYSKFKFFLESWESKHEDSEFVSIFDSFFKVRKRVSFYKVPQLDGHHILETYKLLSKTNFPTLYASTSPFEDFAESFVTYVHTQILKKPFSISIIKNGKKKFELQTCWTHKRCDGKRKILEEFLVKSDAGAEEN